MPPRIPVSSRCLRELVGKHAARYATAQAITPAPSQHAIQASLPLTRYPPSQPPSHKPAEFRRSQLHRQYTSLLKSNPLILVFQHNNLKAQEWMSLRRELTNALRKVDSTQAERGADGQIADYVKIQVIHSGVFGAALRVAEYFEPGQVGRIESDDPRVASSISVPEASANVNDPALRHGLSRAAHAATFDKRRDHPLVPLLNGPIALLTFPSVSTEHLKTALTILSPQSPNFPAPTRRANPGWHEPPVQAAVQKLLLLGARVEGSVFDQEKTRWVGTISGGIDGLRAQLINTLQGAGAAITTSLESATRSVYFTLEARKSMLEEPSKGEEKPTE